MIPLETRRRVFAEEVEAIAGLRNRALVEALASVPRERYLPPGPWTVRSESDLGAAPRVTADADPRHVYHNYVVGIDPERMRFNGQPSLLAAAIDALALQPGSRVLHVGTGLGYYTAIAAHVVGPSGCVVGVEVDEGLARGARENLAGMPWVELRHGDASGRWSESFDAILVNAGVTHPRREWIDALGERGRMVLPLTAPMPGMGPTIGKGLLVLVERGADSETLSARMTSFVAIYSAIGLRDVEIEAQLAQALARAPFPRLRRLRLDAHDRSDSCWLHVEGACLSTEAARTL
jgi:protein-L-isoaspartate(D-aspartate) O-methyltransferase